MKTAFPSPPKMWSSTRRKRHQQPFLKSDDLFNVFRTSYVFSKKKLYAVFAELPRAVQSSRRNIQVLPVVHCECEFIRRRSLIPYSAHPSVSLVLMQAFYESGKHDFNIIFRIWNRWSTVTGGEKQLHRMSASADARMRRSTSCPLAGIRLKECKDGVTGRVFPQGSSAAPDHFLLRFTLKSGRSSFPCMFNSVHVDITF